MFLIKSDDKNKLHVSCDTSHWCHNIVPLESYPFYSLKKTYFMICNKNTLYIKLNKNILKWFYPEFTILVNSYITGLQILQIQ